MPHDTLLQRIRAGYLEMPGLRLTLDQAQRLCGVERVLCQQVLATLVETRFLCVKPNGVYARVTDGAEIPRPQPAKVRRLRDDCRKQSA
jgi:DNA-binding GntR family transcriptional regulator